MAHIPTPVLDYLNNLATAHREPAYLIVDREGLLTGWGGRLEFYGIADLKSGRPIGEQLYFLEGLFPLTTDKLVLPFFQTESGRPADLHFFSHDGSYYALLLDATEQEAHQRLLQQKGNELNLSYQQLIKEIQKKEILLHCIVHDLAGPLMGIRGGFELLANEDISEQGKKFLEIGLRQATKQESLIREILRAFSAEVESFEAFSVDPARAPDALRAVKDVMEALSPAFALNQVELRLSPELDQNKNWKVVGEKSRLERVISNLIENALRHSPANSCVTINCNDRGDKIEVAIDDQGPGIPEDVASGLFQKFVQGKKGRGKIGLGLYFCRITIEHWGGEIGHEPLTPNGTRFWFRLPKPAGSENAKHAK